MSKNSMTVSFLLIFQMGTHAQLIARPKGVYAELMRIQQSGIDIL